MVYLARVFRFEPTHSERGRMEHAAARARRRCSLGEIAISTVAGQAPPGAREQKRIFKR